ncbi:MAG: LytTR family DNA-binding domain-containing protein [Clostridia bacterium]|nr:LytTR family DNA-binding domain-containing protein [Clostridia bacterium]
MNIACVDDNKEVLAQLESLLGLYSEKKHTVIDCTCYDNTEIFLDDIKQKQYNIVFMDIYFEGRETTGIEAARRLRQKDPQCIIVFLTSSSDHMPEAFAVHAFSYITKDTLGSQLENVLDDAIKVLPVTKNLTVRQGAQEIAVPHHKIICAYTDGHYLNIRLLDNEPLRMRMTFHELLEKLDPEERFLRINKGVLVNMDHIQTIEEGDCGMIDGTWLPVRHRGRNALIASWRSYQFNKLREEQS